MKYILIILLFFAINTSAQTYLKVADKPEYAKYLEYCNAPISRSFKLLLKVSTIKVDGLYMDSKGNWVTSKTPTISLVPYGTKTITTTESQKIVTITVEFPVQRRIPSVADFYKYWKTNFIQEGLMDERSGGF